MVTLSFRPSRIGGVSVGQQEEVLERLEGLQAGLEQLVPASVVRADIHPGHPDASSFPVLEEHLQLLAAFLDAVDPDPRSVRLSSCLFFRIQRERDLLRRLLNRLPDRHLVDRPPEGLHDLGRHTVGRERSNEPQLSENLLRDACSAIESQKASGDVKLVRAAFALNLQLLQDDPLKGRQNLRLFAMTCFPDEFPVVAAFPATERFLAPGHDPLSIPDQGLLEKVRQNLRQQRAKPGKKSHQPTVLQLNPELTVKFHRDICLLWGHSHNRPFLL